MELAHPQRLAGIGELALDPNRRRRVDQVESRKPDAANADVGPDVQLGPSDEPFLLLDQADGACHQIALLIVAQRPVGLGQRLQMQHARERLDLELPFARDPQVDILAALQSRC